MPSQPAKPSPSTKTADAPSATQPPKAPKPVIVKGPAPSRRVPTKASALQQLKHMGVPVETVLDVGVLTCTGELMSHYRDKFQLLMEPIEEWNDTINKNYSSAAVKYELLNVAVSDSDGEIAMEVATVRDTQKITHARMSDEATPDKRIVPMRKIDTIVAERTLEKPFLLKVDIDGAELQVIAGAEKTLADCSVVILEVGITNMLERIQAVQKAGFQIFDIVDICYYNGRFVQADIIFLSHKTIQEYDLSVYKDGFDISKWKPYQP
ncbi:FkbM family methyltransferase [Hyphococcus sp. DH-69]|uniref:FkbM family methyltransferase n=1 Tax=Hyphococcus formosus TaxID=3143534 RepID=UPI00398B779A